MAYSPIATICKCADLSEENLQRIWNAMPKPKQNIYLAAQSIVDNESIKCKLKDHAKKASVQLEKGENIGRRGTPVCSIWDMRPKWEKWGDAWETEGTDGDAFWETNEKFVVPAILKLVYFKMNDGKVCQLAYEIVPEKFPSSMQDRNRYSQARCAEPKIIA